MPPTIIYSLPHFIYQEYWTPMQMPYYGIMRLCSSLRYLGQLKIPSKFQITWYPSIKCGYPQLGWCSSKLVFCSPSIIATGTRKYIQKIRIIHIHLSHLYNEEFVTELNAVFNVSDYSMFSSNSISIGESVLPKLWIQVTSQASTVVYNHWPTKLLVNLDGRSGEDLEYEQASEWAEWLPSIFCPHWENTVL